MTVLPLTWTENWEAPITVARMWCRASASRIGSRRSSSAARSCPATAGEVAEGALLAAVDVLGDAAGEAERLGCRGWTVVDQQQLGRVGRRHRAGAGDRGEHVDERADQPLLVLLGQGAAELQRDPEHAGDQQRRLLDPHHGPALQGDQPAADGDRGGAEDPAVGHQRQLGRAAADVDVQPHARRAAGLRHRAGAVRGHHRLQVVAGGRADEPAGLLREQVRDGPGVAPLERLPGQHHRPTVHSGPLVPGLGVAAADEVAQHVGVDAVVRQVRREQHRRAPEHLAVDDDEPAGQPLRESLQVHPGEHQAVRVDALRLQRLGAVATDRPRVQPVRGRPVRVRPVRVRPRRVRPLGSVGRGERRTDILAPRGRSAAAGGARSRVYLVA